MESSANTDLSDVNQDTVREVMPFERDSLESRSQLTEEPAAALQDAQYDHMPKQEHNVTMNTVVIRHPRSMLITAAVQLCLALQIAIFGVICHFYDGCPYKSALWMSAVFIINAVIGIVLVKYQPKRCLVYTYSATTLLSLMLGVALFCITAWLLDQQEKTIRSQGWRPSLPLSELNRIVENTKIAMYTLHMVFTPAHVVCTIISTILCIYNLSTPEEEFHRAYYVSKSPLGHQTILVPLNVHTGANVAQSAGETDHLLVPADSSVLYNFNKGTQTTSDKEKL